MPFPQLLSSYFWDQYVPRGWAVSLYLPIGEKIYVVTDYLSGGELFFHLQRDKKFDEGDVA